MAMEFNSGNIEVPVDLDAETVCVDLYEDAIIPGSDGDELVNTHMVRLKLNEDQAVELATLLLEQTTKLRGERLAGLGL